MAASRREEKGKEGREVGNGGVRGVNGPRSEDWILYINNTLHAGQHSLFFFSLSLSQAQTSNRNHFTSLPKTFISTSKSITMADDATKAALRAKFDKLTPGDFQASAGNRDTLAEKVAAAYSIPKEEALKQVDEAFASAK